MNITALNISQELINSYEKVTESGTVLDSCYFDGKLTVECAYQQLCAPLSHNLFWGGTVIYISYFVILWLGSPFEKLLAKKIGLEKAHKIHVALFYTVLLCAMGYIILITFLNSGAYLWLQNQ